MREPNSETEFPGINSVNSVLNLHQMLPFPDFDPASSHEDFLQQMLSSVPPSSAAPFPWADDQPPPGMVGNLEEPSTAVKMRQQQISNGAATALMLQQQLLLSRGLAAANGSMPHADQNDVLETPPSGSANLANDASIKALFNAFTGSLGQTSNQSQHFHHPQQSQNFGAAPAMSQPAASGSTGGGSAGQPKQRVRAKRGQATDPHSIAERLRRERIAERMKALQELVPNGNKTDKASMLDEIIDYVKFLRLQVKVLSVSRLGGAAAVPDKSPEERKGGTHETASSSEGTEQQVAKLMEEDMGSAMQYLQGKGLCLMPISLATAISATTSRSDNPFINGNTGGPLSPSLSALTVQSAATNTAAAASRLE
ncbi:hypothetical protein ACS0TY_021594 [Phlomoides rotata]